MVKIGRTHLEDAVPLTVGQEWSGYTGALDDAIAEVEHATAGLLVLAMGGTAVGTGLNAPAGFGDQVAAQIAQMTGTAYVTAPNKFTAQGTLDRMVRAHAGLKAAAVTLFKIANDLRWLGSGPRTGLGELIFPANEPGSSIMPGKVNSTQAEAMLMVAIQIIASDVAVTMGGNEGNFELNAFRPKLNGPFIPLAVGAYIMAWGTMGGPYDGASMNPARSLGPDVAIGDLSTWWVYLIGPVAGAVIAVGVAHVLRGPARVQEASAAEGEPLDRVA